MTVTIDRLESDRLIVTRFVNARKAFGFHREKIPNGSETE